MTTEDLGHSGLKRYVGVLIAVFNCDLWYGEAILMETVCPLPPVSR